VVDRIDDQQVASLNKNIMQLIDFLYGVMEIFNNVLYNPNINLISLKSDEVVKNEKKMYGVNVKALNEVFDNFNEFYHSFKGYTLKESSKALPFNIVQKLVYYMEKCRFLQNIIEEEYKSYDESVNENVRKFRLQQKEELKMNKTHTNVFDRLFYLSKKPMESKSLPQVDKKVTDGKVKEESKDEKNEDKKKKETKKEELVKEENGLAEVNTNSDELNDYMRNSFNKIIPHSTTSYGILRRAYIQL